MMELRAEIKKVGWATDGGGSQNFSQVRFVYLLNKRRNQQ